MGKLQGKNILVTGGTGLVGSNLIERLLREQPGKIVTMVRSHDEEGYFFSQNLRSQTIMAYGDLKDKERVMDIVSKYEINYIFHVAAQPIVTTAYVNPYETLNTNIMGTVHILEAARLCGKSIEGVIVASSDKSYGKECLNATETQPLRGDHPYDVSKSCTDLIALTYARTYGVPVVVSRFGNIFGPGDTNWNRIVPGIMKAIITGTELVLRSDGSFVRDYVYVKDVVEGYVLLAEHLPQVAGEAFNFSSGYNYSVLQLIQRVGDVLGTEVPLRVINSQRNEIPQQSLNFDKAVSVLGWRPQASFITAVKETFAWYRSYFHHHGQVPAVSSSPTTVV